AGPASAQEHHTTPPPRPVGHCLVAASTSPDTTTSARRHEAFAPQLSACMAGMHVRMDEALRAGNADHIFAASMIPHHRGAIDMARLALLYAEAPELRTLALKIIADQEAEVELLRGWLERHPGPVRPAAAARASTAPHWRPPVPITGRDRVYTADQVSNTVSVIDPSTDRRSAWGTRVRTSFRHSTVGRSTCTGSASPPMDAR
ncbi:MAG: DUF305 domain-containing protein, partial [Gemmatimonadota bacterium]|nr:DUF305 domain-containing protein [Gemmatimonadota bacterium]